MKTLVVILFASLLGGAVVAEEGALTRDEQIRIIESYMYLTGQTGVMPQSLAESQAEEVGPPVKCGTPAIIEYMTNYDKFDRDLRLALGVTEVVRPTTELSYDSPEGHFKIHYDTTGSAAVYDVGADTDGDGVPNYVESVADIADSVYRAIIVNLGFPAPLADTGCSNGGDERTDIYIINLQSAYGWTQPDTACAPFDTLFGGKNYMLAPSFMAIDNDYAHISQYSGRPLDAVRVTLAHEYFHVVQFGMDWTEWENLAWLEMSAVFMEEYVYDEIDDYIDYLPSFFNVPRTSIQQAQTGGDLHMYASSIFPIYLGERFGPEIIRYIWEHCADLGPGGDFLEAVDRAVDSASGQTGDFGRVFAEFALWNYFTGERSAHAPNDMGYSEKANYPMFPDDVMANHTTYPLVVYSDDNEYKPEHNAATYIRFLETRTVQEDRFWVCENGTFPDSCEYWDQREIMDTVAEQYELWDSVFIVDGVFYSLEERSAHDTTQYPWGISIIYQLEDNPDSFEVETIMHPSAPCTSVDGQPSCNKTEVKIGFPRVNQYRSITMVFTPATAHSDFYSYRATIPMLYGVREKGGIDTPLVNVPAAWMLPYPSPAVLSQMTNDYITFKVQVNTDSTSYPIHEQPYIVVDLFSIAGERVATIEGAPGSYARHDPRLGVYEIRWDMNNMAGNEVASGVYMAFARLYSDDRKKELLADIREKVAIIR